jgi:hypothetical protein
MSDQFDDESGENRNVHRRCQMRIESRIETCPDGFTVGIGRQGHDRDRPAVIGIERPDLADHTEAILSGHRQVAQHDSGSSLARGKTFRRAAGCVNPSPKGLQHR